MQKQAKLKWLRCGLAFLLAAILVLSSVAPLFADTVDDLEQEKEELENELEENEAEQERIEEQIEKVSEEMEVVGNEIVDLDAQIEACVANIAILEQNIAENETLMGVTEERLGSAKDKEEEYLEAMKDRLRMMYEYGDVNYLELLLGSKSISDFFSRIEYVNQMASYDEEIQQGLEEARKEIQEIEGVLSQTELQLNIDRSQLETEKTSLEKMLEEKQNLLAELDKTKQGYIAHSAYLESQNSKLEELIREKTQEIEEAQKVPESTGGSSSGGYVGTGNFTWPVPASHYVSSPYGMRLHPIYGEWRMHTGIDIGAGYNTPIVAADDGYVFYVSYEQGGYGNFIMIDHGNGYVTLYAHCNAVYVYSGQTVSKGQQIAVVGSTGASTGPHLHFEIRVNGSTTNPMNYYS